MPTIRVISIQLVHEHTRASRLIPPKHPIAPAPAPIQGSGELSGTDFNSDGPWHDQGLFSWLPLRKAPPQGSPSSPGQTEHERVRRRGGRSRGTPPARRSSDAVCRENQHGSNPSPEPPFRHPSPRVGAVQMERNPTTPEGIVPTRRNKCSGCGMPPNRIGSLEQHLMFTGGGLPGFPPAAPGAVDAQHDQLAAASVQHQLQTRSMSQGRRQQSQSPVIAHPRSLRQNRIRNTGHGSRGH